MPKSYLQTTPTCTISTLQKKDLAMHELNNLQQELIVRVRGEISLAWTCYISLQILFGEYFIKYLRQQEWTEVSA